MRDEWIRKWRVVRGECDNGKIVASGEWRVVIEVRRAWGVASGERGVARGER